MPKVLNCFLTFLLALVSSYSWAQSTLIPDMLDRVLPSVVTVVVYDADEEKRLLGTRGQATDIAYDRALDLSGAIGSGSGFVIEHDKKKYVITNAHVVEEASDKPGSIVIYSIDRTKYNAKLIGGDSFYDLAVLELLSTAGNEISILKFKATDPRIGEQVFAIGNPLGEYPYSVSEGIISAKNRIRGGITGKFGFLQSTATVIWGNSGGPLVDLNGDVVGVNSQIAFAKTPDDNDLWQPQINFALESSVCQRIIRDVLTNNGRVRRAYLGIELSQNYEQVINENTSSYSYELKDPLPVITGLLPNSPAEKLLSNKIGYSIVKVGSVETRNLEEIFGEFEKIIPGTNILLTIYKKEDNLISTVNIATVELAPAHMETLAKFQIAKNISFELSDTINGVWVNYKQNIAVKSNEIQSKNNTSTEWKVVSLGLRTNSEAIMWKIESLGDFGSALRLVGLIGHYTMNIKNKTAQDDEIMSAGFYISGKQEVISSTLWY